MRDFAGIKIKGNEYNYNVGAKFTNPFHNNLPIF